MPVRVVLADDHEVVREGLAMFMGLDPDLEIVGQACNGVEAVELARRLRPDLVVMDLLMPLMDGVAATAIIRREMPDTEVLALTSVLQDSVVVAAIRAGAIGYLLKNTRGEELCRAVKAAAAGQVQLSPEAAARLMQEVREPAGVDALTGRETEVLTLIASGASNKEIAARLGISEKTTKIHVSSILAKLGLPSRTQAALYAVRAGLVAPHAAGLPPAARPAEW